MRVGLGESTAPSSPVTRTSQGEGCLFGRKHRVREPRSMRWLLELSSVSSWPQLLLLLQGLLLICHIFYPLWTLDWYKKTYVIMLKCVTAMAWQSIQYLKEMPRVYFPGSGGPRASRAEAHGHEALERRESHKSTAVAPELPSIQTDLRIGSASNW
jgi:hypothetical protein